MLTGDVELLLVVVIMGALVAFVLRVESPGPSGCHGGSSVGSLSVSPANGAANVRAALKATCESDYQTVSSAVDEYQALHGQPPTDISRIQPMLKDAVSGPNFAILLTTDGKVGVATPGRMASSGSGSCKYA